MCIFTFHSAHTFIVIVCGHLSVAITVESITTKLTFMNMIDQHPCCQLLLLIGCLAITGIVVLLHSAWMVRCIVSVCFCLHWFWFYCVVCFCVFCLFVFSPSFSSLEKNNSLIVRSFIHSFCLYFTHCRPLLCLVVESLILITARSLLILTVFGFQFFSVSSNLSVHSKILIFM